MPQKPWDNLLTHPATAVAFTTQRVGLPHRDEKNETLSTRAAKRMAQAPTSHNRAIHRRRLDENDTVTLYHSHVHSIDQMCCCERVDKLTLKQNIGDKNHRNMLLLLNIGGTKTVWFQHDFIF